METKLLCESKKGNTKPKAENSDHHEKAKSKIFLRKNDPLSNSNPTNLAIDFEVSLLPPFPELLATYTRTLVSKQQHQSRPLIPPGEAQAAQKRKMHDKGPHIIQAHQQGPMGDEDAA